MFLCALTIIIKEHHTAYNYYHINECVDRSSQGAHCIIFPQINKSIFTCTMRKNIYVLSCGHYRHAVEKKV